MLGVALRVADLRLGILANYKILGKSPSWFVIADKTYKETHCIKSIRIRSYSDPYSVQIQEDADQNNSEYGHFSRSDISQSFLINSIFA